MRKPVFLTGFFLVLVVSTACSSGSIRHRFGQGERTRANEIEVLKAQIVELQRQAAIAEVEIGRLQKQVTELEASVGSTAPAKTARESKSAAGETRQSEPVAPPPNGSLQAARLEISDLPTESEGSSSVVESAVGADADRAGSLDAAAQALYDRGYTLFHRGHYIDSETAFQQFLNRYGATVLGDNAQFWIAEARYARGDVRSALAAYLETASRFPGGNKAPDALLKAGECSLELGDKEGARRSFRAVVEEFPGSAASIAAREQMARLP